MCVGEGAPQDVKKVIGLRIDEKLGNYCHKTCLSKITIRKIDSRSAYIYLEIIPDAYLTIYIHTIFTIDNVNQYIFTCSVYVVVVVVRLRSWFVSVYVSLLEIAEFLDRFHWFASQVQRNQCRRISRASEEMLDVVCRLAAVGTAV